MLKEGKYHMRHNVPDLLRVVYGGVEYYPVSYTLEFDNCGNTKHIATIHDLKANCVHDVLLKDLEEKHGKSAD
jgi:hypothetical protein